MAQTLPGFQVTAYATGLDNPRLIRRAPNGDLFVAESGPGRIKVLRGIQRDGKAAKVEVFVTDLTKPFGIAFYPPGPNPQYVYIANTNSVVRFQYQNGDLKVRGRKETVTDLPGGGLLRGGGHWTRDLAFSPDGKRCSSPLAHSPASAAPITTLLNLNSDEY
jgi:glucose/arabinose dehydrogenase